jgi:3-methyladenine DNA glycosylase AlkC
MDRLPYRRKFSAGLEWNVLRGGLFDRKIDTKILSNEEEITNIQLRSQLPVSMISLLYERINALFAYQNLRVLALRAKLLSMKLPLAKELLARKQIPRINLMKIEQQQADVEGMLAVYAAYGITLSDSIAKDSSMFYSIPNFDLDPLMMAASEHTLEKDYGRISHLTEENVRYNYHPIKSVSVDVKTNYNLYDYDKTINAKRNFFNIALAASAPLSLLLQNKKALIKNEAAMKTAQMEEQKMQISEEDRNTFYALKYKQKQYLNYQH